MKISSTIVKKFFTALLVGFSVCTFAIPVSYANAQPISNEIEERSSFIAALSGALLPGQTIEKSFITKMPMAIKVGHSSFAQEGNQNAPIKVYLDGSLVAENPGNGEVRITYWSLGSANHVLQIVNGNVWPAASLSITTW